jgi:hypothetical protein
MDQNHVQERRKPFPYEVHSAFVLVGKIIVLRDGVFTQSEINFAQDVVQDVEWNKNTQDFLDVVAGTTPGENVFDFCYTALTYPYEENNFGGAK